jgi:hypothetical protein
MFSLKPHQKKQALFLSSFFGFIAAGLIIFSIANNNSVRGKFQAIVQSAAENTVVNGILVNATINGIDVAKHTFEFRLDFTPVGSLVDPTTRNILYDVIIIVGSKKFSYPKGLPIQGESIPIYIQQGNENNYPFDRYCNFYSNL